MNIIVKILIIHFLTLGLFFCQGKPYDGPDDPAGDRAAERSGYMNGNRVLLFFRNTTELSDCCGLGYEVSKWPNNFDGTKMHDGIATLVGARVYLENNTTPVTIGYQNRTDLDTLYYIQSSYREHMDFDNTLTVEYGLYPVFGYFNELSETPAISNKPESWPPLGWPVKNGVKWEGLWNGRFGAGVTKADLECYFVTNDAQDLEYLKDDSPVNYFPRPGVKIGDKKPDVTINKGEPWGGIGVRIETRGFQWSNPSANDAIFWEHNISNISDYDLPEMIFGFWMDNAVGGEEGVGDDLAYYDTDLNMAYSWDVDFVPVGGGKAPGLLGFAYLESPGLAYDGIDNDDDGILDEKRDNIASVKVGPQDGYYDLDKFLEYYKLDINDLKQHWDADEDQDWKDGEDLNGNGIYDGDEDPGDDVGLDGLSYLDINYPGPDADGTECNHKPDFLEGVGCEPNFAATDVSESDQLGLTSFHYTSDIERTAIIRTDESLFLYMADNQFHEFQDEPLNFMEFFASGIFPLFKGRTERVSMAELHSYDPLSGLMDDSHAAPSLFRLKEVVQVIYETDYRFAQPPLTPTLTATPSDGKILLSWDDIADTKTREEFLQNVNDFEGYKLYRATDKKMSDAEVITDGYGNPRLKKPIFQCDVINLKTGFAEFGAIDGVQYYLGEDTGIRHYYIDEDVENGKTYYYVLVAYDYGIEDIGGGIAPSENTFSIELDESENVIDISKNVAIVRPHQYAAGYIEPIIEVSQENNTLGTNPIALEVKLYDQVKPNHTYRVEFNTDTVANLRTSAVIRHPLDMLFTNNGIRIYDETLNDSLVYLETPEKYSGTNIKSEIFEGLGGAEYDYYGFNTDLFITGIFDGIQLSLQKPIIFGTQNTEKTGWLKGDSDILVKVNEFESQFFPWQYTIIFTDNDSAHTTLTTRKNFINDENNQELNQFLLLDEQSFNYYVINNSKTDSSGKPILLDMIVFDENESGMYEPDSDKVIVGYPVENRGRYYWGGTVFTIKFPDINNLPKAGDEYRVDFFRPYTLDDSFVFTTKPAVSLDEDLLKEKMDKIKVVPNPYIMTNEFEPNVSNYQLNQRRQIMFTNIPAQSSIKIFTVSGVLIDEIIVNNSISFRENDWDLNSDANGTVFWDLKTKEGLGVAAGYYIFHVKSNITGDEKIGKFAIIK